MKVFFSCKTDPVLLLLMLSPFTEDTARMSLLVMSPSASPVEIVAFGTSHSVSSKVMGYSSVVEYFRSIFKALGFTLSFAKNYNKNMCVVYAHVYKTVFTCICTYAYVCIQMFFLCMSVVYCAHVCRCK